MLTLLQDTTGFGHTPSWRKIGSHLEVIFNMLHEDMAVVMDNMYSHVRLYTSSTQGTTGFDHTPSWSEIVSHLVVIFNM